jgi:Zn-dependent peptidase ImmA (M78 family)
VAAEVLVPKDELLEIVKPQSLENDLPKLSKHFHVSPEVIMRRSLTLEKISLQDYQEYRKRQQEKYKDAPASTGGHALYHKRLVNTSGEHFARTAFVAYYEEKITLARLAAILSNFNTKHLSKIESAIFG